MKTILFVCTGNTCRSPMAEALMEGLISASPALCGVYTAASAGTFAYNGSPASAESISVMDRFGHDIRNHRSKQLTTELLKNADLILAMEPHHLDALLSLSPDCADKAFTLKGYAKGSDGKGHEYSIADPYGGTLNDYRRAADEIHEALKKAVRLLENNAAF